MANLFIGFPVPRAKIADMIEGAAPPLEHISNHLPPGSDPLVLPGDIEADQIVKWTGTKFIGAAAPAGVILSPMCIHSSAFIPQTDETDYVSYDGGLRKGADAGSVLFIAPVSLPHGVTVTKLIHYGFRNHADAILDLQLRRMTNEGGVNAMADVLADWTDGDNSKEDTSIANAVVNNANYSYCLYLKIQPYDYNVTGTIFRRAVIEFS